MPPRLAALLVTAAALLALPAAASADDFCVGAPAGCTGTPVASNGLAAALTAAESNGSADRFFLAPGIFADGKFSHQSGEQLQLIGAGAGKTIMRGDLYASVLTLGGNQDTSVSDLTLEPVGAASSGLTLLGTHARGVAVDAKGVASLVAGVQLFGDTTFDDGSVDLGTIPASAVVVFSGTGTVTDSTLSAPAGYGFVSGGTEGTVRRSTLDASVGAGHLSVSDSLIDLRGHTTGAFTMGVLAGTSTLGATNLTTDLDRVTIAGSTQETIGVAVEADGAGKSSTVHVRDSVIQGAGVPVARQASNGATADLTTDRSYYPLAAIPLNVGPGSLVEEHHLSSSPRFVDAAGGDFHLAADSPLIDAGTPGELPAGTADRDGKPRASDGDGDCAHVSDIGAYELQGTSVKAVAGASAGSAKTGEGVSFSAAGSCIPGPGEPAIAWSFDDGGAATGTAVTHAFTGAGRHSATVTVSDGDGHHAAATVDVDVTAPATPPPAAAPVISRLKVAPRRIAIGKPLPKLVSKAARRPLATIAFTLSEPATVELRFAKLREHAKPTRIKTRIRVNAKQGANRIRFAARLTRKLALKPGAYKLTLTATGATGTRSNPATTRFNAVSAPR